MADKGTSSNNDLDIKLGITIEDYATVAAKIDALITRLQKDKGFTIKVDAKSIGTAINKAAEEAKKGTSKIKTEFDELGRGYKTIAKAMKSYYQTEDNMVSTSFKGKKNQVREFTVSVIKAGNEIEKLTYKWDKEKKGFVFSDKQFVDKSGINELIKNQKIQVLEKEYATKLAALQRQNRKNDTLNNPAIANDIKDIEKRIKSLNKLNLNQVTQETKLLAKDFQALKEKIAQAKVEASEMKNQSKSKSSKSPKNEYQEITNLSKSYNELYKQIELIYGKKGQIDVISKGELDEINAFTVKLKESEKLAREFKYTWGKASNGKEGYILEDITNKDTRQKANKKEQEEEIKRLNTINNLKLEYGIKMQDAGRSYGAAMGVDKIISELDQFKSKLNSLDGKPLKDIGQATKELSLAWKQLTSNMKDNNIKETDKEFSNLSRDYKTLQQEIKAIYGSKGQIDIISKGELDEINSFTVKVKESEALTREFKYILASKNGQQGFILEEIKNLDNYGKAQAKATEAEVNRINKVNNLQMEYNIKLQNLSRGKTDLLKTGNLPSELEKFKQALANLKTTPLDKLDQKTKELALSWKQFAANVKDAAPLMRNDKYDTWIAAITKKTKDFFTWYISANAVMQSKNFLMDSVRQINQFDEAVVELSKVTDLSASSLDNMSQAAIDLSKSLGKVNASEIMLSMAEFGRVTKDAEQIKKLSEIAGIASNVTSLDSAEAAKALNTTVLSMKLNLNDSMAILDQFNEIQNNYRTSAEDLAASIGEVGAIAQQSGISLAELNGYTTALVSSTGISGQESGTAWVK